MNKSVFVMDCGGFEDGLEGKWKVNWTIFG